MGQNYTSNTAHPSGRLVIPIFRRLVLTGISINALLYLRILIGNYFLYPWFFLSCFSLFLFSFHLFT